MSDSADGLLQKIQALQKINKEIITRLKSKANEEVIDGYAFVIVQNGDEFDVKQQFSPKKTGKKMSETNSVVQI
jgi:hypothetical protein